MPGDWTPISPPLPPPLYAAPDLRFLLPASVDLVVPITCPTPATGWCEHRRFRKYRVPYAEARRDPMPNFTPAGQNVSLASTYLVGCSALNVTTPHPVEVASGGDDGMNGLPIAVAESYYGWRVAGGDDRYDGIVAYPIDAHDDTLIFTYRDGEASVRVTPTPHGAVAEQTLLHASDSNCEPGTISMVRRTTLSTQASAQSVTRPIYADGTLGPACIVTPYDQLSSCGSCDPGCCPDESSG